MRRSDSIEVEDKDRDLETLLATSDGLSLPLEFYSRASRDHIVKAILIAFGTTSILLNFWLATHSLTETHSQCRLENHRSPFSPFIHHGDLATSLIYAAAGLALDVPTTYRHHSDWWSGNTTVADDLWESIDTDPMVVALDDTFVQEHNLPASARFPWDNRKGRYFLKVFHDLHCLKFIHRYIRDLQSSNTSTLDGTHVHHCLDTLRQDVLCRADDTPMPTTDALRAIGDKQPLMCKNYNKLVEWAYMSERHACHRSLSDYKPIVNSIERYAFCEEGSKNEKAMKQWFEVHGHGDPWEKEDRVDLH